ncbi:MAG TPA: T9SS type A sorting domain-containing protein [Candidatus Kapabacteria bacterium]|nr:T9SS type A sorting domain-containing protein [Candidatus Kapabacteria bacterium]
MKIFCSSFIVFITIFIGMDVYGQEWKQTNGPGSGFLRSITIDPKGTIFALSSYLHRSTDSGKSWEYILRSTGRLSISQVIAQPSGKLLAVVTPITYYFDYPTSGKIIASDDHGDSWDTVAVKGIELWQGSLGEIFTVDSTQALVRSTDDGISWKHIDTVGVQGKILFTTSDTAGHLFLITGQEPHLNSTYRSTDDGMSWSLIVNGLGGISNIAVSPMGTLIGYSDFKSSGDGFFRSIDGGRTWENDFIDYGINNANNVAINKFGNIIVGDWASTDDGKTWYHPFAVQNFVYLNKLCTAADPSGFFLGNSDSGITKFSLQDTNTIEQLYVPDQATASLVSHPSGNLVGFSYYDSSSIWYSNNNEKSWKLGKHDSVYSYFGAVYAVAIDSSYDILAGEGGHVIRSDDAGAIWTYVGPNLSSGRITAIAVDPSGHVFATTPAEGVFRSTDRGHTWDQLNKGITNRSLHSIAIHQNSDVYVGGYKTIYKTIDKGLNWTNLNTNFPLNAGNVTSMVVDTKGNIIAGIDSIGVWWSSDNGLTWKKRGTGLTATKINALVSTPIGKVFAGTDSGVFYLDTSATVWTAYSVGLTAINVLSLCRDNNGRLYAGTDASGVFSSIETFNLPPLGVENSSQVYTSSLGTIYPNPTSTTATIPFSLGEREYVMLDVTDALGRTVAVLADGMFDGGAHLVQFVTNGLAPGMYYVRIHSGSVNAVKPVVVSKE